MTTVRLVAKKPLTHAGRAVQPGDTFLASPVEAAAYTHNKQAEFAPSAATRQKRRQYRRADLEAEK
jgi:hypothetical protein